jgi:hypothetical protein
MTNYPAGAERGLARLERDELAYEQWGEMAYKSGEEATLAMILADAVTEELNYPEYGKIDVKYHALARDLRPLIKKWLMDQEWLYEWEAAHHLIPSFEEWRAGPERDPDREHNERAERSDT